MKAEKESTVFLGVVHPWLCDGMGHMSIRHYVSMFEEAGYHFFHLLFGYTPGDWPGLGWADVRQEIDYLAELRSGALLRIDAGLERLGGKSLTCRYTLWRLGDEQQVARMVCTTVLFDLKERKATALTAAMRESAGAFLMPARQAQC